MSTPIRLAINGASGRMGRALTTLVRGDRRFTLQRAVVDAGSERVGQPLYTPGTPDTPCYAAGWESRDPLDAVVDFSSPDGLAAALGYCRGHGSALVVGTTGLDADLEAELQAASRDIAILRAANFSLGIAVLTRLVREAAAALPEWDLEIIEAHHGRKLDAPSGTALALGQTAATARGSELGSLAVQVRDGHTGERFGGSIGFAVVRGGDIVGEHTVMLATRGERLELTHRATDRAIFARGALTATAWLASQDPGIYTIDQVLDDRLSS